MQLNKKMFAVDRALKISFLISCGLAILAFLIGTQLTGLFQSNDQTVTMSVIEIFCHNALISFILILSVFSYGLIALLLIASNFLIFGMQLTAMVTKVGFWHMTEKIFWHALFELPAIMIAASFGFYLFVSQLVLSQKFNRNKFCWLMTRLTSLVLALDLIASIVEVYVSNGIGEP
ncbi:stage II sporulation protein M [Oenococcus sicerae]|uniref:stage II sporulation protein M n=1 Tax=Oenococcus sicerae TaxID=2203724 RepID=UPI0010BB73EF|nr:hypothetical protein OAL24_00063 [Oenococcus sicerae]